MRKIALFGSVLLGFGLAGCGDDDGGGGAADAMNNPTADAMVVVTPDANNDTQAPTTTANPVGGNFFDMPTTVTLTADEPATIYYTTDGTEPMASSASGASPLTVTLPAGVDPADLKFWAEDGAGNAETTKTETYTRDASGMIVVSDFAGTVAGTVMKQPNGYTLAVTNVAYDDVNDILTVSVDYTSAAPRLQFNVKSVFGTIDQGTLDNSDGQWMSREFHYLDASMIVGGTSSQDIVLSGVDGPVDPLNINLDMYNNAMLLVPARGQGAEAADSGNTGNIFPLDTATDYAGPSGNSGFTGMAWSADGTTVYAGLRNSPRIVTLDTTNGDLTGGVDLSGVDANGATNGVYLSPDGMYLYVLYVEGRHREVDGSISNGTAAAATNNQWLIRLNATTLAEVDRLHIVVDTADSQRLDQMAITADGTTAAILAQRSTFIYLVDLSTMTLVDTDAVTKGDQPIDLTAVANGGTVHQMALSPDETMAYVAFKDSNGDLAAVNLSDYTATTLTHPNQLTENTSQPGRLAFGPDGRLYYSDKGASGKGTTFLGNYAFDLVASTSSRFGTANTGGLTFRFSNDGRMMYLVEPNVGGGKGQPAALINMIQLSDDMSAGTMLLQVGGFGSHDLGLSPF